MAREAASCSIDAEKAFGPTVTASCLEGFDFTLYFEETILTIVPLGIAGGSDKNVDVPAAPWLTL